MFQTFSPISSAPLWVEIGKLVIGPLIAAVVVILGLIWRDRIERRNAAQSWYEKTYIEEAMDVFISHLSDLQYSCLIIRREFAPKGQVEILPPHVSGRLSVVVPGFEYFFAYDTVEAILLAAHDNDRIIESPLDLDELYFFAGHLLGFAESIRRGLLHITVKEKRAVYDIRRNSSMLRVVAEGEMKFQNGQTLEDVHRKIIAKYAERGAEVALAKMTEDQKGLWRKSLLGRPTPTEDSEHPAKSEREGI